jgi:hypothetical protein
MTYFLRNHVSIYGMICVYFLFNIKFLYCKKIFKKHNSLFYKGVHETEIIAHTFKYMMHLLVFFLPAFLIFVSDEGN